MVTYESQYSFNTDGDGTIVDITDAAREIVEDSGINSGQMTVIVPGSTAGITTIEYEPGLLRDLPEFFEKIIPSGVIYGHDATWGDGNGFSHLRAAIIGPSVTVPVSEGGLVLGTWQQIVFLEFDNRPRSRRVHFSLVGE
jgi:secondary thiamine-phosphate synthase enzyme